MNWLYYLAEANLYLGVFYLAYCLFLNRETYYQLNRAYLIGCCIISFILPVLQIGALKPVQDVVAATSYTVAAPVNQVVIPVVKTPAVAAYSFTLQSGLWEIYLLGAVVILFGLVIKLYTLFKLVRHAECVGRNNHKIVYLTGTDVAFSFFNYLFIGTNAAGANTIIRHELVHIRQRHSADIIFLELLKIINWFNPVIYLLQNSLKTVHEYIADEQTAIYETDALAYSSFLVNNAYGAGGSSITHSFFNYNLLKKRIIMLNQQRSGSLARLKYLVAAPICAGLLCASTLAFSKSYGWVDLAPATAKLQEKAVAKDTAKLKRLRITQNGGSISTLTDKFSVEHKGKQTFYYANTITSEDINALLKDDGMKVEIVDVQKPLPPPPPPAPPVNKHVTGKGYTYEETGYLIKNKTDYRVVITEKNGERHSYFRNASPPEEIRWLAKKYGYTFPTTPIYTKLPPPPPMEPKHVKFPPPVVKMDKKPVTLTPPSVDAKVRDQIKLPPPGEKIHDQVKLPPPGTKIHDQVKLPPPGAKIHDQVKLPPPGAKIHDQVKLPPPGAKVHDQVKLPPPPPVGVEDKKVNYLIDPNSADDEKLNEIKGKLDKQGYHMDFKRSVDKQNQPSLEISLRKNNADRPSASATFNTDFLKANKYLIALGFDDQTNHLYIHSLKHD